MAGDDADRVLLEMIGDLQGVLDLEELQTYLVAVLRRAVPSDWVSLNGIGPTPEDFWAVIEPAMPPESYPVFGRLSHQNPLIERLQRTQDGRAYRFSDVIARDDFHALELYTEFYAPIGLEHQIAITLPSRPGWILGIALSRREHDFSDTERDLLNRARPYLIQIYRNVLAFGDLRAAAGRDDPAAVLDRLRGLGLTPREAQAAHCVALGQANQGVAETLGVSVRTVHKHLEHVYRKLGVRSRSELAARVWSGRDT